jgi:hypothetical protein
LGFLGLFVIPSLGDSPQFAKQIKFTSSDSQSTNNFLDYLLLWLDGENSTEMPKIESATDDDSIGEDEELSSDDDE